MVFTEQQLQVKKLVDVQQDIEIDALNDGVGALSTSMQNGFTEAANNFSDIQNSLAVMNGLSESRYNTLYDSVNILSNDMSNIASGLGDAISNVASDMINMNNGIQNQFNDLNNTLNTAFEGVQNTFYYIENDYLDRFNQVNTNIGDSINNFHNEISNDLYVNVFSADTMIYNVSATPVNSLTALGYDSNGKIIPVTVIANTNIQFPPNANYLYTDVAGTAFGGTADTEVNTNNNLITSYAVYNALGNMNDYINSFYNTVTDGFNDIQNDFNDINNNLSSIHNDYNTLALDMNSGFNDVSNSFNDVYNSFNLVDDTFAGVQNQFNNVNNNINTVNGRIPSFSILSETNNSTSTGYLVPGAGSHADGYHVLAGNGEWVTAIAVSSGNIYKPIVTAGAITKNTAGNLSGTLTFKDWSNNNVNVKVIYGGLPRGAENYTFNLNQCQIPAETTNTTKSYYIPFYPINRNDIMPGLVKLNIKCTVSGDTYTYTLIGDTPYVM
jgi:uncharacterized phage infection (PIP) family protein YhgE